MVAQVLLSSFLEMLVDIIKASEAVVKRKESDGALPSL